MGGTTLVSKLFSVFYSFIKGCNGIVINKEAAIISSPGYKLGPTVTYPSNLRCSWRIHNPRGRELTIVFDDNFDTEVDFDVLTVMASFMLYRTNLVLNFWKIKQILVF
jgi:hypothetical protein